MHWNVVKLKKFGLPLGSNWQGCVGCDERRGGWDGSQLLPSRHPACPWIPLPGLLYLGQLISRAWRSSNLKVLFLSIVFWEVILKASEGFNTGRQTCFDFCKHRAKAPLMVPMFLVSPIQSPEVTVPKFYPPDEHTVLLLHLPNPNILGNLISMLTNRFTYLIWDFNGYHVLQRPIKWIFRGGDLLGLRSRRCKVG